MSVRIYCMAKSEYHLVIIRKADGDFTAQFNIVSRGALDIHLQRLFPGCRVSFDPKEYAMVKSSCTTQYLNINSLIFEYDSSGRLR